MFLNLSLWTKTWRLKLQSQPTTLGQSVLRTSNIYISPLTENGLTLKARGVNTVGSYLNVGRLMVLIDVVFVGV